MGYYYKDKSDTECEGCNSGCGEVEKIRAANMEKYGWIIDAVVFDTDDPDCHTHGLPELLNHPDLQIKIRGQEEYQFAGKSLHRAVKYIQEGGKFTAGHRYVNIVVEGMVVTVRKSQEGGREVLQFVLAT